MRTFLTSIALIISLLNSTMIADVPLTIFKRTTVVDGIEYTIHTKKSTATLSKVDKSYFEDKNTINIPRSIEYNNKAYRVDTIGECAFEDFTIHKIVIPNSIVAIKHHAFDDTVLDSLVIEDGDTEIEIISEHNFYSNESWRSYAFGGRYKNIYLGRKVNLLGLIYETNDNKYGGTMNIYRSKCDTIIVSSKLKDFELLSVEAQVINLLPSAEPAYNFFLSDSTKVLIADRTIASLSKYQKTSKLKTLILGNHSDSIPAGMFSLLQDSLETLNISKSFESITLQQIIGFKNLKNLIIESGNRMFAIEDKLLFNGDKSALLYCMYPKFTDIEKITLPATVKTIADEVFKYKVVRCVEAPGLEHVGKDAFLGSDLEELITISKIKTVGERAFSRTKIKTLNLDENITEIPEDAFFLCYGFDLPAENFKHLISIGKYAFYKCGLKSIKKLTLDNVTFLDSQAFSYCDFEEVEINSSLSSFTDAFCYCCYLKNIRVKFKNKITSIPDHVFAGCSNLTGIEFIQPNNEDAVITEVGDGSFYDCIKFVFSDSFFYNLEYIGPSAFAYCASINNVKLRNIKVLGDGAFAESSIGSIELDGSLTKLPNEVFKNCTSLESVTLSDGITMIGKSAFEGCTSLKEIDLGESIGTIERDAFKNCGLNTLYLGGSLKKVYVGAFENNCNLARVYCNASIPPEAFDNSFKGSYDATLYVPVKARRRYELASGWRYFLNIEGDESLSDIEETMAGDNSIDEYYDLNGLRVENPIVGRTYIRRRGSKVEKVLFRD